jgi:hypothetical protein
MPYSKERWREWYQRNKERLRDRRSGKTDVETFGSTPWQEFPGTPESKPLPEGAEGDIERIMREDPFLYFLLQTETD